MNNIRGGLKYIAFALIVLHFISGTATAIVESTWGYEYDTVGTTPLDSRLVTEVTGTSVRVSSNTSHNGNNSLYIYDDNVTGVAIYDVRSSTNTTRIINGSMSMFINFSNTQTGYFYTYNTLGSLIGISLRFSGGTASYFNGTAYVTLGAYSTNISNNITLVFNSVSKTFDYYLNGSHLGSGVYRQASANVNILHFETNDAETPKYYIDDLRTVDSDTPTLLEVRKFPYPYVAAWTLSSDIDDTSWGEFYDIYDFLNTDKNISGLGNGTNLELSSNFWMQGNTAFGGGNVAGCYYQTAFSTSPLCENSSITLDYLRSGHLDTAHNWASTVFNMSIAGDFSWYINMLSVLNSNSINITAWVNHGGPEMITNLGTASSYWAGDNSTNASAYHLNRSMANQSLKYLWESGTVSTSTGTYINYPLEARLMDDNSTLFMFYRVSGGFAATPYNRNFSSQINYSNIHQLIRRSGYAIKYTHLGYNGTEGGDVVNPVFDAAAIQELRNISDYYHGTNGKSKQIYVATLSKLLRYAEVSEYLNYTYNSSLGTLTIHSVNSSVRNFTPTVADLEGITFLVPTTTNIFIGVTNVTSSTTVNVADENGNVSIMFPIARLSYPYPNISSVGSYNISSNGTVLWNRTTTRPARSQSINIAILPSSGSVDFTSSIWNTTGDYRKVFTLSSSASVVVGDFPANTWIQVNSNGVLYNNYLSNGTGYISFSYVGGATQLDATADLSSTLTGWTDLENDVPGYWSTWSSVIAVAIIIAIIAIIFIIIKSDASIESFQMLIVAGFVLAVLITLFVIIPAIGYSINTIYDGMVR